MTPLDVSVVLISPRNPLNIGAAARAMANFGFTDLRVVNPYEKAFREAVSAAAGAAVLASAQIYDNVADAVADRSLVVGTTSIGHRELQHPIHRLEHGGGLLTSHAQAHPTAILFGSEKFGLSNDDLSYCNWLIRIPTDEHAPSMNLGQSVAVCLYELIRQNEGELLRPDARRPMTGSDSEQVTRMLLEVLGESGYTNRIVAVSIERKLRRFIRRARFGARDAPLLMGILRQVLWKFREPRG